MISLGLFVMLFVQTFLLDKSKQSTTFSIMNTHTHFNRQTILDAYIDRILDDMDIKDLMRIVGDYLEENFFDCSSYTDIDSILDDMDIKDLMRIVGYYLEDNLSGYTDAQLITEIENDYPELLDENVPS
jgi:muconolactone delta-isomerase